MVSRTEAQQRADAIGVFRHELERLEREGVFTLTEDQRRALRDHHSGLLASYTSTFDIDPDSRARQLSLGMRVASFLGAVALGVGVALMFYNFWGRLTTPVQVAILTAGAASTFAGTLWIRGRDGSGYFTNLAATVAMVAFILDIAVLGRIFNMTPTDGALVPWAAVAFILAYTCDLRLLLAAGIALSIGFLSSRIGSWDGLQLEHVGSRPENFLPAGILAFVTPLIIRHDRSTGFPPVYRVVGLSAVLVTVFVLSLWGRGSYLRLDEKTVEGFYQVIGFAACVGAVWLGIREGWRDAVNVGVAFFVLFLYSRLFDWWWDAMPEYLFFLMLGAISLGVLFALRRLRAVGPHPAGGPST
jgi:hypothetical protein